MSENQILFESGEYCFGEVSLVNTGSSLVAIAARGSKNLELGDEFGYIELCARVSRDGGKSWGEIKTIAAPPARQITLGEGSMKSAFFTSPSAVVAQNGDIILLCTFFPESFGIAEEKLLDKKKIPYASFDGGTYPVIYDRDKNYYMVISDGRVIDSSKGKTDYTVKGMGELYKGEEYIGNIYLNGAMGRSESAKKTTFGAPLKAPKRSFVFMLKSSDGGESWSEAVDITSQILNDEDGVYLAVSSQNGAVTKSGRIIMPLRSLKGSVCIYSDDNGESWNRNQRIPYLPSKQNASFVQAPGGEIYFLGNNVCVSYDNGIVWLKDKSRGVKNLLSAIVSEKRLYASHIGRGSSKLALGGFEYKKNKPKGIKWDKNEMELSHIPVESASITKTEKGVAILYHSEPNRCISFTEI